MKKPTNFMLYYLRQNNRLFFYNKNTVPSLFVSKYFYQTGYSVFQLKGLHGYTSLRFVCKENISKDVFVLTQFLLLALFKRKVMTHCMLDKTRGGVRVRNFFFFSKYPIKVIFNFFRYLKKLTRKISDVYGFYFKTSFNKALFKFVYPESTSRLIFYYSLRKMRSGSASSKYLDELFFFVKKFYFVFALVFSEASFRQKYFFYFELFRLPFYYEDYELLGDYFLNL